MTVNFDKNNPGNRKGFKYDWKQITADLRARPGKWAVVEGENVSHDQRAALATALRLKRGGVQGAKPGEFEATVRGTEVYARFVGETEE